MIAKNLQGDIIEICNTSGAAVITYTYDAWGNVLSISGTQTTGIGAMPLFRYRRYYCDTDTGLYYLQTRYYDPATARFINAGEQFHTDLNYNSPKYLHDYKDAL